MNKLTIAKTALLGLTAAAISLPAFADRDEDRYDDGLIYAKVVSARPNYHEVRVNEPRQECRQERVVYRDRGGYDEPNVAGAILGGLIGGVAGHQIGNGRGRDVATGIGAVVGAGVGANAGRGYRGGSERVNYEQRCDTVDSYRYESRLDGYDVTYRYNGRLYTTNMPYDPGRTIALRVDVQPVR